MQINFYRVALSTVCVFIVLAVSMSQTEAKKKEKKKEKAKTQQCLPCEGPKKVIAIYQFKDDVHNMYTQAIRGGLIHEFEQELMQTGCFVIVPVHKEYDEAMKEKALVQPEIASKFSDLNLKQTNTIVMVEGIILQAAYQGGSKTRINVPREVTGGYGGTFGLEKNEVKITLGINIFDSQTGRKLVSGEGEGSIIVKQFDVSAEIEGVSVNGRLNRETNLGKATLEAIHEISCIVNEKMKQIPWESTVLKVADNVVFVKGGSVLGIDEGQIFDVYTNDNMQENNPYHSQKTGVIRVTKIHSNICECEIVSGTVSTGMSVKLPQ